MLRKVCNKVHDMTSRVHDIIWKHVLRLDSIDSDSISITDSISDEITHDDTIRYISEIVSPIGSLNTTVSRI